MADIIRINLDVATQAADIALKNLKKTTQDVDNTFAIFKGNFAAGLAVQGVQAAFGALQGFLGSVIDEAAGSEQAIQGLNIALKSTGLFTPKASAEMQEFAGALQNASVFGDEAIMGNQALLLSLTNLSRDGVNRATQAAADLAATLGVDLDEATSMIAKGVNGNVTSFKKLGIEIQKGGTDAERLANLLKALESQQGAAAAASNTFAGSMAKAKNQVSENAEAIGKLITQHPLVVSGLKSVSEGLAETSGWLTENKQFITDVATALAATAAVAVTAWGVYTLATTGALAATILTSATVLSSLGLMSGGFVLLTTAASTAWAVVTAPVTLIVGAIALVGVAIYQLVKNWDEVKASTYEALAATIEFAAQGVELFSEDRALILQAQAQGFREQAVFIREAAKAAREKADGDKDIEKETEEQKEARLKREAKEREEASRQSSFLAANRKNLKDSIVLTEAEGFEALLELNAGYYQAKKEQEDGFEAGRQEAFNAQNEARLERRQELEAQELELQIAARMAKAQSEDDEEARRNAIRDANDKAKLERIKLQSKQELDTEKLRIEGQKKLDAQALAAKTNTMNLFTSLAGSKNKELAMIGKAAGLVQIGIASKVAVAEAFEFGTTTGGPVLGGIFAGIAAAAMAAQAAELAGLNFANGGIVPGTSFAGDRVQANVNSGEMVLNRQQQATLFEMANGKSSGGGGITAADLAAFARNIMSTPIVVQVDGRELIGVFRDQYASGRTT